MNYNDGSSDIKFFGKASLEELKERAKDYSEGNEDLEKTLLILWDKQIRTKACCVGHDDESYGYFCFLLDNDESFKYLKNIYQWLRMGEREEIKLSIENKSASLYFPRQYSNFVFSSLKELCNKEDELSEEFDSLLDIMNTCDTMNLISRFELSNKDVHIFVYNHFDCIIKLDDNVSYSIDDIEKNEPQLPFYVECSFADYERVHSYIQKHYANFEGYGLVFEPIDTIDYFDDQKKFK